MNDLLNLAIKAHGGLERWRQVRSLQAKVTLNGTLWRIKGRPNGLPGVLMRADTRQPALTMTPFPSPGSVGHFTPDRVWIAGENNKLVSELNKPRDSIRRCRAHDEVERTPGTLLRWLRILELLHDSVPTGAAWR